MSFFKDVENKVVATEKGIWAKYKTHIIGYPVTAIGGMIAHWVLGKLL